MSEPFGGSITPISGLVRLMTDLKSTRYFLSDNQMIQPSDLATHRNWTRALRKVRRTQWTLQWPRTINRTSVETKVTLLLRIKSQTVSTDVRLTVQGINLKLIFCALSSQFLRSQHAAAHILIRRWIVAVSTPAVQYFLYETSYCRTHTNRFQPNVIASPLSYHELFV